MTVREIFADETAAYQAFFRRGLVERPECFRISPADLDGLPFPTRGTSDSFTLGAFGESGDWLGIVSFQREGQDRERLRHRGLLFWMFVADEAAGRGLGRALVEAVLARVRRETDVEQVVLTVVGTNLRAKRLYAACGFETYSYGHRAIKWGDTYLDEESMVLFLENQ